MATKLRGLRVREAGASDGDRILFCARTGCLETKTAEGGVWLLQQAWRYRGLENPGEAPSFKFF
jgi:hypothetical protein